MKIEKFHASVSYLVLEKKLLFKNYFYLAENNSNEMKKKFRRVFIESVIGRKKVFESNPVTLS